MGIIPERTAEEQEAYDLSLERAFGETSIHTAPLKTTTQQGPKTPEAPEAPNEPQHTGEEYSKRYGSYRF